MSEYYCPNCGAEQEKIVVEENIQNEETTNAETEINIEERNDEED